MAVLNYRTDQKKPFYFVDWRENGRRRRRKVSSEEVDKALVKELNNKQSKLRDKRISSHIKEGRNEMPLPEAIQTQIASMKKDGKSSPAIKEFIKEHYKVSLSDWQLVYYGKPAEERKSMETAKRDKKSSKGKPKRSYTKKNLGRKNDTEPDLEETVLEGSPEFTFAYRVAAETEDELKTIKRSILLMIEDDFRGLKKLVPSLTCERVDDVELE